MSTSTKGFTRLTGFTREDVIGKTSLEIDIWHDPDDRQKLVHGLRAKGFYENLEAQFRRKDGILVTALMSATVITINNEPHIISITRDITELKQAEKERKINLELLRRLNQNNGLHMLMEQVTELMRDWSGCDAVGIRLQEGEDFPYFETRGLPAEFILHENRLCATDMNGERIRDSAGNPVLECMCGNVICGRFDPTLPFFTENGSFWTNSTTDLLSSSSETDRQARTRNRCHAAGYESVALIPLRHGEKNLGLLQFNDFRRDRFDVTKIELLERLASNLSIGLIQCRMAETLAKSEEKYRLLIQNQNELVINFDLQRRILFVSNSYCKTFGKSENELLGSEYFPLVHEADIAHVQASLEKVLTPPYETHHEEQSLTVDGWRWFAWSAKAVLSADGQVASIVSVGRDITDRKSAEQALRESEAKFRSLVEGAPNGLYVQDGRSCFVYINQAALRLFGARSQDQLLGKPVLERFHPDFHDEIRQRIRTQADGGSAATGPENGSHWRTCRRHCPRFQQHLVSHHRHVGDVVG
jgi:PAS domain S-box-containing protein